MNKKLIDNGLDLKLTLYDVMATSSDTGFIECIYPSTTLNKLYKDNITLKDWLWSNIQKKYNLYDREPESNPYFKEAMKNYIKSCGKY